MGRTLDWDAWSAESVSDSFIYLSNAPFLCGFVSVNGLDGEIATTEKQAEKKKHTEKAVCMREAVSQGHCWLCENWQLVTRRDWLAASTLVCINRLYNSDHTQNGVGCYMQMTITALYIHPMKQPSEELSKHLPASHWCTYITLEFWGYIWGVGFPNTAPSGYYKWLSYRWWTVWENKWMFSVISYRLLTVTAELYW